MIWELSLWFGFSVWLGYVNFKERTDEQKIERIFETVGYNTSDSRPALLRTDEKDLFSEYVYNVPYGLVDDPKLQPIIEKTLGKPVEVFFDGKLHIRTYTKDLPQKVKYDWQTSDPWSVPIGIDYEGMVYHSFDKIPHMTVAGMTRQGKTVLLKLILGHLINQHPDDAEFYIIDLKGGLEFNRYRNLKQVKYMASNVYEAQRCLKTILRDVEDLQKEYKAKGYTNVLDTPITKRKFVIVDEGAELTPGPHHTKEEKKVFQECQHALSEIARIAGALSYRLIFCTQYPTSDTLPRQVKQNSDAKISFRLPTEVASRVAVDENGAEQLPCPGRAIYRTHEKKVIQVPLVTDQKLWEKVGKYEFLSDDDNVIDLVEIEENIFGVME